MLAEIRNDRVYPRACGGTAVGTFADVEAVGLSPRLRGNRIRALPNVWHLRSIPAPAGEPQECGATKLFTKVYPRACGGTAAGRLSFELQNGLSPRLRGNLSVMDKAMVSLGSIPAPAGEPQLDQRGYQLPGGYPRACGGTCRPTDPSSSGRGLSPRLRGNLRPMSRL